MIKITRNNLLLVGRPVVHLIILPLLYINSLAPCHNLIFCDLDHLPLPQDITVIHYIDVIILIRCSKQEGADTLTLLMRHLCLKWCKINRTKFQSFLPQVKFLGDQWCRAYWAIPSKLKGKLLHLVPPTTKKKKKKWYNISWSSLDSRDNIVLTWVCCASSFTKWPKSC